MALTEPNSSSREYRAISPSRVPLPSSPLSSTFSSYFFVSLPIRGASDSGRPPNSSTPGRDIKL
jgi:hypothetical protein